MTPEQIIATQNTLVRIHEAFYGSGYTEGIAPVHEDGETVYHIRAGRHSAVVAGGEFAERGIDAVVGGIVLAWDRE